MPAVPAARVAVVAVWLLTLIGVVLIDALVPDPHALSWLALALPLAVVAGRAARLRRPARGDHGRVVRARAPRRARRRRGLSRSAIRRVGRAHPPAPPV
jgi:hypothetical protein